MVVANGVKGSAVECEVLIVGAGFSGLASLYRARKAGLNARVFEAGDEIGGVWNWNRYPGARVDSEFPFNQLDIPEVYRTWNYSQRFPDHVELRKYMAHVDKTLHLTKDITFGASVVDARYDVEHARWTVTSSAGHVATSQYLVMASGLLHRPNVPKFPGMANYTGILRHPSAWPAKLDCRGKKVAVIGSGATAVQIIQELSKETAEDGGSLTVFMRRPSNCLPMGQRDMQPAEQTSWKAYYPALFQKGRDSYAGLPNQGPNCNVFEVTAEERRSHLEELWRRGGFNFIGANYNDMYFDSRANREIYDFWAEKTRARMSDPRKRDILAPLQPPYPFGTKRTPLEQDFYECIDMKHVEVVDLNSDPIKTFTESGILSGGRERAFDVIITATGFDAFTGSMTNMGLKNKDGIDLQDVWMDGVSTYLGMLVRGFPNLFIVYSPQAPNALVNGPTVIQCQADMVIETINRLRAREAASIEPTEAAEESWKALINAVAENSLFPQTSSWWTGGNIPGKRAETLTFFAGIDTYEKMCREKLESWDGFDIV